MKHPILKKFFISTLLVIGTFISSTAIAASTGTIDPNNAGFYKAAFLDSSAVSDTAINFGKFTTQSQYNITVSDTQIRGYAWGASVGYIVTNCLDTTSGCSTANGNFKIANANGVLSGYAWGENTGWINFGPFTSPSISTVKIDSTGNFGGTLGAAGYAWSQNYGWIIFDCTNSNTCVNTDWRVAVTPPSGGGGSGTGTLSGGGFPPGYTPPGTTPTTPTNPTTPTTPTGPTTPPITPATPGTTDNGTPGNGTGIGNGVTPEQPNQPPAGGNSGGPNQSPTGTSTQPTSNPSQSGGGPGLFDNGITLPPAFVESITTITSSIGTSLKGLGNAFAPLATGVIGFARTPIGSTTSKLASAFGIILTLISAIAIALISSPFTWADLLMLPLSLWNLLLIIFGFKRRHHPWGTVYDSVTKQPIDPAYVVLTDLNGNEVATSITDIDGRYGFSVPPGSYKIIASKTNFNFPSMKLAGQSKDELYDQLYFGEVIEIKEDGEVITKNIPMDQLNFDWNEFAKTEQKRLSYYKRSDVTIARISNFFFAIGFIIATISLISAHTLYNSIIFVIYVVLFLVKQYVPQFKSKGSISDAISDDPLPFAILRVLSTVTGQEISHKVADRIGSYYCLVPNGTYNVTIDKKNADASYTKMVVPYPVTVKEGYLRKDFKV
ncbi:MAG: carboxypeptidase-like regulatory domain-containing protein [Candidatus Paceibacterota bacterium]